VNNIDLRTFRRILKIEGMYSIFPDFELKAHKLLLQQAGASSVPAVALTVILRVFGGIV
jgi:hypothetical protein